MKFLLVGSPTRAPQHAHKTVATQVLLEILIRRADRGRACRYAEIQATQPSAPKGPTITSCGFDLGSRAQAAGHGRTPPALQSKDWQNTKAARSKRTPTAIA